MEEIITSEDLSNYVDVAIEMAIGYLPSLLLAAMVLIIGLWIVNRFVRVMARGFARSKTEPTLATFLENLVSVVLKVLVIISAAGMVGIETTSFIAVLGAAGLAIGLAMQGSLANFAGGVLVLMFRPYRVGDYIEAQGVDGTVKEIQILHTVLTTPDNKRIIVPNGAISNGVITNYSTESTRRVDFVFGIGYGDDIKGAREVIRAQIDADERILDHPPPQIVVSNLGDSSVDITVRVWANAADYWGIKFDLTEQVKTAFDEAGITIPFPQRDVHLMQAQG